MLGFVWKSFALGGNKRYATTHQLIAGFVGDLVYDNA